MDLKRVVSKIGRYLHRDLKYLMRQTKVLQEMKNDVLELEKLLKQTQENKDLEVLVQHYKKRIKKEDRFAERIERRLNVFLQRLEGCLALEEAHFTSKEQEHLEELKTEIEVAGNNLVRILAWKGELHNLIEEGKNWKAISAKIKEALGNDKQIGIISLITVLEELEELENNLHEDEHTAKEIAQEKLDALLSNDFKNYGLRFMHWSEFFDILKEQELKARTEISIVKQITYRAYGPKVNNFIEYLEKLQVSATHTIFNQTDYPFQIKAQTMNQEFHKCLREAFEEYKKNGKDVKKIFLDIVKKKPVSYKSWDANSFNDSLTKLSESNFPTEDDLKETRMSKRNLLTLKKWWDDPSEKMSKWPLLFRFMASFEDRSFNSESKDGFQYYILAVIKGPFEEQPYASKDFWGFITGNIKDGSRLIAGISIVKEPQLLKQMVSLSQTAGEFSCPIMSLNGIVRFPKIIRLLDK